MTILSLGSHLYPLRVFFIPPSLLSHSQPPLPVVVVSDDSTPDSPLTTVTSLSSQRPLESDLGLPPPQYVSLWRGSDQSETLTETPTDLRPTSSVFITVLR